MCNYLGIELYETVVAPGMVDRGAVRKKKYLMDKAHNAGQKAIKKLIDS